MALLLQARTCSDQGRTLEALQLVKRGLLHIERAHADAPRVTDALAVLGAYQYFASHLPWYVRTLAAFLVLPPDREQGRERLEQAAANARYCAAEARAALTTAAWWDSDAEHALGAAAALTNAFPANYHFALLAQHVMLGARRTGDALAAATHTLAVIQRDDRPAAYGMIADQQYMLGLIRIAQTNYQAALTHFGIAATVGRNKPWIQGWALLRQGMMHDVLGRREAARQCYAAACGPEYRSERLRQFARAFGARPYAGEAIE